MPQTEASRALKRMALNYIRLGTTLVLGLAFVSVVVGWVGIRAFGLINLVTVSIGLAGAFRQLTNLGLIQQLGAALHDDDPDEFPRVYASSFIVSSAIAGLCLLAYGIIFLALPLLSIDEAWMTAARVLTVCQAAYSALVVLVAPIFSLYAVRERFGGYAVWMILERASGILAVVILAFGVGMTDIPTGLIAYGIVRLGFELVFRVLAIALVIIPEARFRPNFRLAERAVARRVLGTFSWRGVAHIAMLLYENGTGILMNLGHGLLGSGAYGLGLRLTSYVRMATTGVTFGTDATAARLSSRNDDAVPTLAWHTTRFQALIAIPAAVLIAALARPLIELWVGRHMLDEPEVLADAIVIVRILAAAIAIRALADGWMSVLYGSGHVRRYAPLVFIGGVTSLVVGGLLVAFLPSDSSWHFHAPVIAYAAIFTVVQSGLLPFVVARALRVSPWTVLAPAARPALVALAGVPVLYGARAVIGDATLLSVAGICTAYGAVVATGAWAVVLTGDERRRLVRMIARSP